MEDEDEFCITTLANKFLHNVVILHSIDKGAKIMQRYDLHRCDFTIFVVYAKQLLIISKLKASENYYCND